MVLVDRERALAQMSDAFEVSSSGGGGRMVVVAGCGSSGRTTLVHRFAEQAAHRGALVLTAGGSRLERDVPGGVLCQLVSDPAVPETSRDAVGRLMSSVPAGGPDAGTTLSSEYALTAREVLVDLVRLSARRPLVLVVDDVDVADPLSVQVLLYLHRRIASAAVLVVLAESDPPVPGFGAVRGDLYRLDGFQRIRITPLSTSGVRRLLTAELNGDHARSHSADYHRCTAGNPRLVRALAADRRSTPGPWRGVVGGQTYRDALLSCVHRDDGNLLDVARAVAVLDGDATEDRIRRLVGDRGTAVGAARTALERMGVLSGCGFRLPSGRDAVLGDMGPAETEAWQRRIARMLFEDGASQGQVAARVVAGGTPCPAWSVPLLRAAADEEVAAGRPDRAAELLRAALTGVTEPATRVAVTRELAWTLFGLAPSQVLGLLPELQQALERDELGPDGAAALFLYQLWHGHETAARRTRQVLTSTAGSSQGAVDTRCWTRWVHPGIDDRFPLSALSGEEVAQRVRADAEAVLRRTRLARVPVEHEALALGGLVRVGALDQAQSWCTALRDQAAARRSARAVAVLTCVQAEIDLFRGQVGSALHNARTALDALPRACWGIALPAPLATSIIAGVLGTPDESPTELLRTPLPEPSRRTWHWLSYLRARGAAHLAAGRTHAALADIEACGALAVRWKVDVPALMPWRSDLAEALILLGRLDRAERLLSFQLARPTGEVGHVRARSLLLLSACTDGGRRLMLLREAADTAVACGDRLTHARALATLSVEHRATRESAVAAAMAAEARQVAGDCGIEALCGHWLDPRGGAVADGRPAPVAEHALGHPGADVLLDAGAPALSGAETRVAEMAANGLSNREISRSLYITVSTVEQHLTRSYRKLAIRNRGELRAAMAAG